MVFDKYQRYFFKIKHSSTRDFAIILKDSIHYPYTIYKDKEVKEADTRKHI